MEGKNITKIPSVARQGKKKIRSNILLLLCTCLICTTEKEKQDSNFGF